MNCRSAAARMAGIYGSERKKIGADCRSNYASVGGAIRITASAHHPKSWSKPSSQLQCLEAMNWAVIQTEAQREHAVRLLLMRAGFETYLPRTRVRNRITPLFAGYLFVRLPPRCLWFVLWTPHVIRLLMSGDQPAQISEEIVNQIRKREHNGLVRLPIRRLRKGEKIRILRGSFEGQIGLYDGMSGKDRERVLLELLGQHVPVELPGNDVAPLNPVVSRETMRY